MKTLLVLGTVLLSSGAHALTQKIELDLNSAHLRGRDTIPLKRMLVRSLGGQNLRGWTLVKAEVEAKSQHGEGSITLRVDRNESNLVTVPGTPENFESDYSGFTKLTLQAPTIYRGDNGRGPIQLLTQGNIKIDDVEVTMLKRLHYDYTNVRGLRFISQGEFKAQKVIGSSKKYHINGHLAGLNIVGTKGSANIDSVEIEFLDGQKIIVDELDGKIKKGHVKSFALRGELNKPVRSVKVSATSRNLFGSRAKLAVELAR